MEPPLVLPDVGPLPAVIPRLSGRSRALTRRAGAWRWVLSREKKNRTLCSGTR